MRILITNDDGFNSEGLKILIEFAKTISDDVWVVAPDRQRTAGGHGITISKILRVHELSHQAFETNGTPADCVLLAINYIMKDKKPDWVLSGVNSGENIGDDIMYSGTIAGAREASMHGIKSIAFSQGYFDEFTINYSSTNKFLKKAFDKVMLLNFDNSFYNVNFPPYKKNCAIMGLKIVPHGNNLRCDVITKNIDHNNKEYFWLDAFADFSKSENILIESDADALKNNYISITPIALNFTNFDDLNQTIS